MSNPFNSSTLEEYRYIRYLLWQKGIKFYALDKKLVWLIRKQITTQVTFKEGSEIKLLVYILNYGRPDQLILNTAEEYDQYLESFLTEDYKAYTQLKNRLTTDFC